MDATHRHWYPELSHREIHKQYNNPIFFKYMSWEKLYNNKSNYDENNIEKSKSYYINLNSMITKKYKDNGQ